MKTIGLAATLLAALLLSACEPTPDPHQSQTQNSAAQSTLPEPAAPNPLLDSPPPVFLAVVGECGKVLFEGDTAMTAADCLAAIRKHAVEQGLPELTDAQLGDVNIGHRWRYEQNKLKAAATDK
ncbi:hypothetical protein [Chitinolyticbacter albus]|uniref:hypothetical protein n=1 Tax=Chitinolyticbacter albus TaxID=2961951 RepID=UPI00210B7FC1|nr:hypothetical protein [Chitinolyticbacter albus]